MQHVAIIGGGRGGLSLVKALYGNPEVVIVGVCDKNPEAPGILEADKYGIEVFSDFRQLIASSLDLDVIINVSNDLALDKKLKELIDSSVEIIHGKAAMLIWVTTGALQDMHGEAQRQLGVHKDLYELGLKLSSCVDLKEAYSTILDCATRLTGTPAGSIAILDEKTGEMILAAAKGFSIDFFNLRRWKLREGGLTDHILNQDEPVVIRELDRFIQPINLTLVREGVKSIMAAPLIVQNKLVGVIYVDDFNARDFDQNETSVFKLLSGYAALAIEKIRMMNETQLLAKTDGLTGLWNQREFMSRLEEEMIRAKRYDRPLSIIELDIDYFKGFNDSYGHLVGNELLKILAAQIFENSRAIDCCARLGGEEFAIIMPETEFEEAMRLAERLRLLIESLRFQKSKEEISSVNVSIGVGSYPEHGQTPKEVYKSADQALYEAKKGGRNRVIGFPDQQVHSFAIEAAI